MRVARARRSRSARADVARPGRRVRPSLVVEPGVLPCGLAEALPSRHGSRFPLASWAAAVRPCGRLGVRWRGPARRRLVEWPARASRRLSAVHGDRADLAITNAGLNLTSEVAKLTPPDWYLRLSSAERLYIGGRVRGFMNTADRDAARSWKVPAENTAVEGRMEFNAELPMAPSGWRVREALSYDLPVLWPSEYEAIVRAFEHAGREQRKAFLRRSGVRWCVLPSPSNSRSRRSRTGRGRKLFECDPSATRVVVTTTGRIGTIPTGNVPHFSTDLPR